METLMHTEDPGASFYREQAVHDAPYLRRFLLAAVIVLCVALPRAGVVLHGLKVPLPYSVVLVYVVFLFVLPFRPLRRYARYLPPFIGFCGCVLLASLIGLVRHAMPRVVLVEVATIVGQLPVFFVVVHLIRRPADVDFALRWLLLSLLFASVYGIMQFYRGADVIIPGVTYTAATDFSLVQIANPGNARRVLSSYGDPNVLAGSLVLFIPALVGMLIAHGRRSERPWRFLYVAAATVLSLLLLVYCNSRAGYIGVIAAVGLLTWKFRSRFLRIALPFIVLAWLVAELGLVQRLTTRAEVPSSDPRWHYAALSAELALTYPEGTGLGVHVKRNPIDGRFRLIPAPSVWATYNSYYMHLLVRGGFLCLGAFLFLCFRFARIPYKC
ncbi:MAG TPA: hypothetical protein ENN09_00030, partial [Planctomycetes bacterium]|nr:hypothetical protein [Planctomycetota bacterium]